MKKLWLALIGFAMSFSVFANPVSGKEYTELSTPVTNQPDVVEFFSFYCPHCYQFEENFKVPESISKTCRKGRNMNVIMLISSAVRWGLN